MTAWRSWVASKPKVKGRNHAGGSSFAGRGLRGLPGRRVAFHVKREGEPPLTISPRSRELLGQFEELLRTRAIPVGIVSSSDAARIMERHILDSLRAVRCLRPSDRELVDVGAGAGLPGIPVAVAEPERHVILVEAHARRAAFLELAVENLGLVNVDIRMARAEATELQADVCFARALAPPERAWQLTEHLLGPGGRLLYFAGRSWSPATGADLAAFGVHSSVGDRPQFAWQGPIVIMARTSQ
jgi:16S rRNA (guanine527-N7)-methyltransferase